MSQQDSDLTDWIADAIKETLAAPTCVHCRHPLSSGQEVGSYQLHSQCKEEFLAKVLLLGYELQSPSIANPLLSWNQTYTVRKEELVQASSFFDLQIVVLKNLITKLAFQSPRNIMIFGAQVSKEPNSYLDLIMYKLEVLAQPTCFICNHATIDRPIFNSPMLNLREEKDVSMPCTHAIAQKRDVLFSAPDTEFFYHQSCITRLLDDLMVQPY